MDSVLPRADAVAALSRKAVRHRIASGRWQSPHRSVVVTHNGPITTAERRRIAVLAAGADAVLAGVNAVTAGGLRGYEDARVHLLVPAGRRPVGLPAEVVVHRTSRLEARDVIMSSRPARTRMARSVVDAAQWARSDDQARAVVATAFQQRLVTLHAVEEACIVPIAVG